MSNLGMTLANLCLRLYSLHNSIMHQVSECGFGAVPSGTPNGGMCGGDEAAGRMEGHKNQELTWTV